MPYPINTNLAYKKILQAHDWRQQLTAQNIANANTPGNKAIAVNLGESFSQILTGERKRISMSRWNVEDQTSLKLAVTGRKLQKFHGVELS